MTEQPENTLTTGLLHILEPVAAEYDQRIRNVQSAQAALADRIDVLSKQLSDCVAEAEFVDVTPYMQKLVNSRKKIMNVATILNNISDRLARMNRLAQNKYPEMAKLRQVRLEKQKQEANTNTAPTDEKQKETPEEVSQQGENSTQEQNTTQEETNVEQRKDQEDVRWEEAESK